MANSTLDQNLLGCQILEALFKSLYIGNSVFFIIDENSKITDAILKNLDEKDLKAYKDYFYRLDPFQLIQGPADRRIVVKLEDLVDYHSFLSTEYYNDFLRPQKIFYKLVVNLKTKSRLLGEICVHRPAGTQNFSKEEIKTLRILSPYLALALEHNELRRKIKLNDNLFKIIEENHSNTIIVLDDSMKVVYMNQRAREFCDNLFGYPFIREKCALIPSILLEDCYKIKEELKRSPVDGLVMPKHRVIQNNNLEKFSISSQIIEKEISFESCRLFLISIEEMSELKRIDQNRLIKIYHLTKREMDIVPHIFKGLRNAEIAEKLFVSEITVKWHIKNIFEKVGVENRTALIHRIFDNDSVSSN
jgi:DNA-binding CsgD family transcriptional regulator